MTLDAEIAELLGYEPDEPEVPEILTGMPDWTEATQPVSVTWLMNAFRMDRLTVKKRLAALAPVKMGRGNSPEYDFRQAAAYLVDPKIDVMDYLSSMKPTQLPAFLQVQFWDAQLKRQTWEQRAGELWRTEDVLKVFGKVFITIKGTIQLWVDTLAEHVELDDETRKRLTEMTDGLQNEIYAKLVTIPAKQRTESTAAEIGEMISLGADE